MKTVLLSIVVSLFAGAFVSVCAQEAPLCKDPIVYEDHNQIEPKPIKLHAIIGLAKDDQGISIPKVCVALFSEKDHLLVASTETTEDGHFSLGKIPPGRYRLVAKHQALCAANVPLVVVSEPPHPKKGLVLHMNVAGIDKCSYGDLGALQERHSKSIATTAGGPPLKH